MEAGRVLGDTRGGATTRQTDWLRRAALHYLERYASSEHNLRRVLERKLKRRRQADPERWTIDAHSAAAMIAAAVEACRALGLVDDAAYAETKAAGGRRRGHSATRIMAAMTMKGVTREVAAHAVAQSGHDDCFAALVFARRRRLGPFRSDDRNRETSAGQCLGRLDADRRDMAALCRQGFDYRTARRVIAMDREGAEAELVSDRSGG
jgi:regulatory protein